MPTGTISTSASKAGISRRSRNWPAARMFRRPICTYWGGPNLYGGVINGSLPNPLTTYTVPGQVLPVSGGVVRHADPVSTAGMQRRRTRRSQPTAAAAAPGTPTPTRRSSRAPRDSMSRRTGSRTCRGAGPTRSPPRTTCRSRNNTGSRIRTTSARPWCRSPGRARPAATSISSIRRLRRWCCRRTAWTIRSIRRVRITRRRRRSTAPPIWRTSTAIRRCSSVRSPIFRYSTPCMEPTSTAWWTTSPNTIGAWDLTASAGFVRDVTSITYQGFLYVPALYCGAGERLPRRPEFLPQFGLRQQRVGAGDP